MAILVERGDWEIWGDLLAFVGGVDEDFVVVDSDFLVWILGLEGDLD